jgi:hypothetical protein
MQIFWNRMKCVGAKANRTYDQRPARFGKACAAVLTVALAAVGSGMNHSLASEPSNSIPPILALETSIPQPAAEDLDRLKGGVAGTVRFPTIPSEHPHVRALLENAMRYVASESRTIDPGSGYPVEGWNNDPSTGLCLRSFTQLTAIGQWMELLANVAAGYADTPYLPREQALSRLALVVENLRRDQKDPQLSAKGLLGNFLDLSTGKRQGLLACDVDKQRFLQTFGPDRGQAIWNALKTKGWISPRCNDREADIRRGTNYGWNFFDGPLAPYNDDATKQKIMAILDQRVVMVVFGDNANLSISVAKTIGTLLQPEFRDRPEAERLRGMMEQFLDDQQQGYAHLYDPKAGLFSFGWDATRDRLFGWEDAEGNWQAGYMDYLVNEFRGPATFVVVRFGLPTAAVKNLGFKMKPYPIQEGQAAYVLAPWEGSAFQSLGLGLSMLELSQPSWRRLLENVVDVEIDYATRHQLPGFLSESYTGEGIQYTGDVGIPEIAVSASPRITHTASLYTLGVAYTIAPAKIERFLAANWPAVSGLLTDHGPWEGFNLAKQEPVRVQTSAHTMSLILGLLGTESQNMQRYLESRGLGRRLAEIYQPGEKVDLLSEQTQVFAWGDKQSTLRSNREKDAFHVQGERVQQLGMAFVPSDPQGVNLSGGLLSIRYRSQEPLAQALIALKPAGSAVSSARIIPSEIYARFLDTNGQDAEILVPLPATPGLLGIKEVVISSSRLNGGQPIDLTITRVAFTPANSSR